MKATQLLHNLGQSLWLDNITRDLLNSGTLKRYIDELSVTGLTSNPTIFDHAIKNSAAYDAAIREALAKGKSGEGLFFDLALDDLTRAADLFRPIHNRTNGVDGWVSLEVSPLLAHDTASTIAAAKELSAGRAAQPVHQDPGHQGRFACHRGGDFCGCAGQRDAPVFARAIRGGGRGVPARHRTAHRRRAQSPGRLRGLGVHQPLGCLAVAGKVPEALNNRLGIAVRPHLQGVRRPVVNPRWLRAYNAGARPQRLLWASTGTKDPKASDTLYIKALAAPFTVNTMPEATLKAFADHGELGPTMPPDGGDCERVLARFDEPGVNLDAWPQGYRTRGPNRSQNPGTSSWT
jgi:transaldolase